MTRNMLETKPPFGPEPKGGMRDKSEKDEIKEYVEGKAWKGEKAEKGELNEKFKDESQELLSNRSPITREALLQHAALLEQSATVLRHFIEQAERPDLGEGALTNEPDDPQSG